MFEKAKVRQMKFFTLFFTLLYVSILFFFVAMMDVSRPYAQESQFFETLYDIPVMAGLEEVPELALSFDKPDGRISQAGAYASDLTKNDILSFYNKSLEQMGWHSIAAGQYRREREKLEIFIEKSGGLNLVRFLLQPL